uniref:Uncharacterized protein n=1 Tax=Rhizophagus irregularis (strain DAOM 181602 / DAOM 197198 / MUCL 43194) TaxID=747089 RepID=U9THJ9_RHIID
MIHLPVSPLFPALAEIKNQKPMEKAKMIHIYSNHVLRGSLRCWTKLRTNNCIFGIMR